LQATYGVSSPELENGGSIEFLAQGTAGADILHWNNLPSNVNFNKFVFDYYFQVDNVAPIRHWNSTSSRDRPLSNSTSVSSAITAIPRILSGTLGMSRPYHGPPPASTAPRS
jgi:hypothetical protein